MEGEGKMDEKPMNGWGMTQKFIGYQDVVGYHLLEAQVGMFAAAASATMFSALQKFRYTDSKTFDNAVVGSGTN